MNTEKIAKYKKSLENTNIPANVKTKIEAEIKRLEDLDAKQKEASEKKEEAPAKKTRAKRTTKATPSRTSNRKPTTRKKPTRTVMSVAKEIRKEGESWKDAQARARKMMKADATEVTKKVESELDKLNKLVKSKKELRGMSGKTNLLRDASRKALPAGRRVSKDGNVYYENRANRADRGTYGKYHLAEGGYLTDPTFGTFQNQVFARGGKFEAKNWINYDKDHLMNKENGMIVLKSANLKDIQPKDIKGFDMLSNKGYARGGGVDKPLKTYEIFKNGTQQGEVQAKNLAEAKRKVFATYGEHRDVYEAEEDEEYARGGSVRNERRHVNHDEDYEVRYAKSRPSRTGYKGKRSFSGGGDTKQQLKKGDDVLIIGRRWFDKANGNTYHTAEVVVNDKVIGKSRMSYGYEEQYIQTGKEILLDHFELPKGMKESSPLWQLREYGVEFRKRVTDGLKRDLELGGNVGGFDLAGHLDGTFNVGQDDGMLSGVTGTQYSGLVGETGAMSSGEMFARGGSVRNERKHVNHNEDYEVRYARNKPSRTGYKGKRSFSDGGDFQAGVYANGGGVNDDSPRIYVADLEAYNSGRLVGEWLDLSDYNDADELNDAIQELLNGWGKEEYAIHDAENLPSGMYSEYMGARDFEQLYEMMDLAKENDLPLAVVQEIVSQYDTDAIDNFYGRYDSAVDFAEQLVDDTGIQSFIDFERYLIISDTDKRLLAQEMADSYVDDIKDEDEGERLIGEADLDLEEYQEADDDTREEMLEKAREIVYDRYYEEWETGLDDPYYFLVEEQGMYDAESFANANFVQIDYDAIADALEYDYTFVSHDGEVYVFNIH